MYQYSCITNKKLEPQIAVAQSKQLPIPVVGLEEPLKTVANVTSYLFRNSNVHPIVFMAMQTGQLSLPASFPGY